MSVSESGAGEPAPPEDETYGSSATGGSHEAAAKPDDTLSLRLHDVLDLPQLLGHFHDTARSHIPFDGMVYHEPERGIRLEWGRAETWRMAQDLKLRGEALGSLEFTRNVRFGEKAEAGLEGLIQCLLPALRNALTYHDALSASLKDPLTSLGNRSAMMQVLSKEIAVGSRSGRAMSLVVMDLDHFKTINDEHGHRAGDIVLINLAEVLKRTVRCSDSVFRYGGEEFVLILPDTGANGARRLAERLRHKMGALVHKLETASIWVTISAGIACYRPGDNVHTLFERADDSLYEAKQGGRNTIVVS